MRFFHQKRPYGNAEGEVSPPRGSVLRTLSLGSGGGGGGAEPLPSKWMGVDGKLGRIGRVID